MRNEMQATPLTDVAIIGAGPIGLTLSNLLSRQGIDHIVFEAHPGLSVHPKARGVSARSMEILRGLGLEADVRAAGLPAEHVRFYRGRDLVDPDFLRSGPAPADLVTSNTPSPGLICSQDTLEPVLLLHARQAGGDVRFGVRALRLRSDEDGVTIELASRDGVAMGEVRARFVVGCDGGASTVREQSGIHMSGDVGLGHYLSVRFEASLGAVVADRASASYFLTGDGRGGFLAIDNQTKWIYQYPLDPEKVDVEDLRTNTAALEELVRAAAGISDLDVDIQDTMVWRMDARLADSYRRGRVLLAGDAAHLTPPTGGHGMNVGIGDVDNLAWRLAAVVRGEADESFLDQYEAERRPIGERVIEISTDNSRKSYSIDDELLLNTNYGAGEALRAESFRVSAEVGRRLPHIPLTTDGSPTSTLDLIDGRFTLLTHRPSATWAAATDALTGEYPGLHHASVTTPSRAEAMSGSWARATKLEPKAALLIRPDGHIAARLHGADPLQEAREAMSAAHRIAV
ncbi:FAD-dependent monooxygenase [Microbacterium sp. NPDC090218]